MANMIKWRVEVDADKIIEQGEEVLNRDMPGFDLQMKSGKTYIHGTDRLNRPIFYIHSQLHDPKAQSFETLRAFTIYGMETGRSFLCPPTNQTCLLFDMSGFGLRNMDWTYIKFLVMAFEAYYPETLGALIIHGAPWIFGGIWRVLKPLLDPVVASKFVFTRNDQELFEYVHPDQLIERVGGNDKWKWTYTDCVDGENARCRDEKLNAEWKTKRSASLQHVEEATKAWIAGDEGSLFASREKSIAEYRATSIEADPYIRPRSVYHRHGNLLEDGTVFWHYDSAAPDQAFGISLENLRAEGRAQSADGKDIVCKAACETKEADVSESSSKPQAESPS
ncbi:hypothetical protein HWV62_22754 [Athelia sp. TMB]|nr:hypothetical protein HWV62_22754 [Athelia sp. TMB]